MQQLPPCEPQQHARALPLSRPHRRRGRIPSRLAGGARPQAARD